MITKEDVREYKKELRRLKKRLRILNKETARIRKNEIKQESGKVSIADNQGGELSIVNTGMLSIKGESNAAE